MTTAEKIDSSKKKSADVDLFKQELGLDSQPVSSSESRQTMATSLTARTKAAAYILMWMNRFKFELRQGRPPVVSPEEGVDGRGHRALNGSVASRAEPWKIGNPCLLPADSSFSALKSVRDRNLFSAMAASKGQPQAGWCRRLLFQSPSRPSRLHRRRTGAPLSSVDSGPRGARYDGL